MSLIKRAHVASVALFVGTLMSIGATPSTYTVNKPLPPNPSSPQAQATRSAASIVAARPAFLRAGADDIFVRHEVVSAGKLQYVSYDRTYRGLPVYGGDFVIVTDDTGAVTFTSVAQDLKIEGVGIVPRLSQSAAEAIVKAQLTVVKRVEGTRLLIYAPGTPRLAWESTVEGSGPDGISRRNIYVDALTGAVLASKEHVTDALGTGNSAWSGAAVSLRTTQSGSNFTLTDPDIANLSCQDYDDGSTITGPDNAWGDGVATHRETGCVDALYAAQTQVAMLRSWLGRNAMDGSGGAWPIEVGLDDTNAKYTGTQVLIGHNPAGEWVGSLDVTGHEMGHGIDDHTPGGLSGGGTQEFVADVFGTATEWFAANPADTPDFMIGEKVGLTGNGALRFMNRPSIADLGEDCYTSNTPSDEVHAAAGPGDHWFYLLAEGTNPANGQPSSPVCSGGSIAGVGLQNALRIMYGAMLMKTTASSYPRYRTWTLVTAKSLDASCGLYNTTKAAWTAVNVPAQPDEPTCILTSARSSGYRSAGWVATDGSPAFSAATGCQASGDGHYCSRPYANSYGNMYFSSFGTLQEFGIPAGSVITKVNIRVTGRITRGYVGLDAGRNKIPLTSSCLFPSDTWTLSSDRLDMVTTFTDYTLGDHVGCLDSNAIDAQNYTFRINYCCDTWSADIDNFEIAFDYAPPFTTAPGWIFQFENGHGGPPTSTNAVLLADGRAIVAGGAFNSTPAAAFYRPGGGGMGEWGQLALMNQDRAWASVNAIASGHQVLVAGGLSRGQCNCFRNTAERYDPGTDTWQLTAPMNSPRALHQSSLLPDGRVLVTGGISANNGLHSTVLNTAEIYDPVANTWTPTTSMHTARYYHQQVIFTDSAGGTKVMVLGGADDAGTLFASTEIYDPATDAWSAGPDMHAARLQFSAVRLHDGRILAVGGNYDSGSESYDPATNLWTSRSTSHPFLFGGVTVLGSQSGYRVLAAGSSVGGYVNSAMLFDPATDTWHDTIGMSFPRSEGGAIGLNDGTALVFSGIGNDGQQLGRGELYVPAGVTLPPRDSTPPAVTGTADQTANPYGWYKGPVSITWTTFDPAPSSGAPTVPPPTVLSQDGANQTATSGPSCDPAGNCTTGSYRPVNIDQVPPTITAASNPATNGTWYNTAVTVSFTCADALSGIADCSNPVTVADEGTSQTVTGQASDHAGNTATATRSISIDKTAPTLGNPSWTTNPKAVGTASSTLSIPASDTLSGVQTGEYFIGTDPGVGHGIAMLPAPGSLTATLGAGLPVGVYDIGIRTLDVAGNWSPITSTMLVVYDPATTMRITGKNKKDLIPNLTNGDHLPGLISSGQTDSADYGFTVEYRTGTLDPKNDFHFTYITGTQCNSPNPQNCHSLSLDATSLTWLIIDQTNNSRGRFQGTANLKIDGVSTSNIFTIEAHDGDKLTPAMDDHLILRIYAATANPDTDTPLYQASGAIPKGNAIRIN